MNKKEDSERSLGWGAAMAEIPFGKIAAFSYLFAIK